MLHSTFERALTDRVITFNPCEATELPKLIKKTSRTLTLAEYDTILAALPAQHRLMFETAVNTGLRWGELIALKNPATSTSTRFSCMAIAGWATLAFQQSVWNRKEKRGRRGLSHREI